MSEPDKEHQQDIGRGYEDSGVSVRQLGGFAAGVVGLIVLGVLGSAAVFHFFVRHQPLGPPAAPFENVRTLPPQPRLQTSAPLDLARYHAEQNKVLGEYGWVDPHAGVVRIPVERAMDLLLQKGFPLRGSSPANGQKTVPGEAPPQQPQITPTPVDGQEIR